MSNWQVQIGVTINVDDCASAKEALDRVRICLHAVTMHSVKNMRVLASDANAKVIERGTSNVVEVRP